MSVTKTVQRVAAGVTTLVAAVGFAPSSLPANLSAAGATIPTATGSVAPFARGTWDTKPSARLYTLADGSVVDQYPGFDISPDGILGCQYHMRTDPGYRAPTGVRATPITVTNLAGSGAGSLNDAWATCCSTRGGKSGGVIILPDSLAGKITNWNPAARPGSPFKADGRTLRTDYEKIVITLQSETNGDGSRRIPLPGVRLLPTLGTYDQSLPGFATTATNLRALDLSNVYGVVFRGLSFTTDAGVAPESKVDASTRFDTLIYLHGNCADIGFDRCYFNVRYATQKNGCLRMIYSEMPYDYIIDSFFEPNGGNYSDSQTYVATPGNPGPHKFVNNTAQGMAETWGSSGGGGTTPLADWRNIECRLNHLVKPMRFCMWHPKFAQTATVMDGADNANPITITAIAPASDTAGGYPRIRITLSRPVTRDTASTFHLNLLTFLTGAQAGGFAEAWAWSSDGTQCTVTNTPGAVASGDTGDVAAGWVPNIQDRSTNNLGAAVGDRVDIRSQVTVKAKNNGETKTGTYVTFIHNVSENTWQSKDGQYFCHIWKGSDNTRSKHVVCAENLILNVLGGLVTSCLRYTVPVPGNGMEGFQRMFALDGNFILHGDAQYLAAQNLGVGRQNSLGYEANATIMSRNTVAYVANQPNGCIYFGQRETQGCAIRKNVFTRGTNGVASNGDSGTFALYDYPAHNNVGWADNGVYDESNATLWPNGTHGSDVGMSTRVSSDSQAGVFVAPTHNPATWDYRVKAGHALAGLGCNWPKLAAVYALARTPASLIPVEY